MESSFMDDIDCGNFFDQIDDLIEFPPDNASGGNFVSSDDSKDFPSMWNDALPESDPLFSGNAASDLSAELSVPYEDIMQLEWLSTFVEDSFSGGGLTLGKESLCSNKEPSSNQFQISSPISVLESSSSSSTSSSDIKTIPLSPSHRGPQRARSKRPRPANFNPRAAISTFIDTPGFSSQSENLVKPSPVDKIPELAGTEQQKKKRRKIKKTLPAVDLDDNSPPNPSTEGIRKCMHCEITKTPQWRAGPMGPKSLCNACGVRYKSGRLFPEYRPAASPTFVPALHSNSHKKVIEMRTKTVPTSEATPPATANPEIVPKVE